MTINEKNKKKYSKGLLSAYCYTSALTASALFMLLNSSVVLWGVQYLLSL